MSRTPMTTLAAVLMLSAYGCGESPLDLHSSPQFGVSEGIPGNAGDLPLRGTERNEFLYTGYDPVTNTISGQGTSVATFSGIGKTTGETSFTVDLNTGASTGTAIMTAINGDQFTTEWTGTVVSQFERRYEATTTSGTGRFANSTSHVVGMGTIVSATAAGGSLEIQWEGTQTLGSSRRTH